MNKPLSGQTILVTGASGEIGRAIIKALAEDGARPIIHYGRNRAGAESLNAEIDGKGIIVSADLSAPDGAFALWQRSLDAAGRIHGLVNNAGILSRIAIAAEPDQWRSVWQKDFQVNFFAAADLAKEAIRHFKANGGGRIINMASRAGQRGYAADAMPYGATKAALVNLTKSIARSFGADGVTAIAIAPGWVRTRMAEEFVAKNGKQAAVGEIPIGEMAEPEAVAELVAFSLRASQASLNGATLDVNGGSYIR
ncbi:NAD(P)-dependent dehydrogenase (short-subunit alcohol dehydrogenase family) [Sinorhizobium kostiense]|uniref:NAD(P)-dependent dehydrogenase (Short-subunit alcohol dehydrogenase family) n=1 Tax=Sinorhizobium kostiense TaxID=76747 RepID=A0ABS4R2H7_9HYPH|nr:MULTISPECIES: SDR family oxidoreductase [Sinorhizobium]MBP2236490.1 NAD(P)-dependent dehydrogenase (short-subunit alcohol dehydrogenase family) [Sinorhizobium kostiense]